MDKKRKNENDEISQLLDSFQADQEDTLEQKWIDLQRLKIVVELRNINLNRRFHFSQKRGTIIRRYVCSWIKGFE